MLLYLYDPKFVTRNTLARNKLRGGLVMRNAVLANLEVLPVTRAGTAKPSWQRISSGKRFDVTLCGPKQTYFRRTCVHVRLCVWIGSRCSSAVFVHTCTCSYPYVLYRKYVITNTSIFYARSGFSPYLSFKEFFRSINADFDHVDFCQSGKFTQSTFFDELSGIRLSEYQ